MRGRVVAHSGFAKFGVDDGIDLVADMDWLFGDHLVRTHTLDRGVAAFYIGDDGVVRPRADETVFTRNGVALAADDRRR